MATFTKVLLSGSTGGRNVKVAATSSPGTLIHTTGTSATIIDEITLTVINMSSAAATALVQNGGTTSTDDHIQMSLDPYEVRQLVICLCGTGAAGREVRVVGSSANIINVAGWVNRITP